MAIEAALCGCETYLIGKIGDDHFGNTVIETLVKNNVNTDFLYKAQAINTGIIVTMADLMGENSGCVSLGANRSLGADEIECAMAEQLIGSADLCLIHSDVPLLTAVAAIRLAKIYSTKVVLKAHLGLSETGELVDPGWPMEFYSANVLIADFGNSTAAAEAGAGNVHRLKFVGSEFVAGGIECVVVNIGQRGTLIVDRQGTTEVPGFAIDMIDHTASGDAFAGALAASCGSGDSAEVAVKFASAAESLAAARYGSGESLPNKEEIIELLQKQSD
jgi:ribokinase